MDVICDITTITYSMQSLYVIYYIDQRALGFSMRVERADVGSVQSRLEELKKGIAIKSANALLPKKSAIEVYNSRLQSDLIEKENIKLKLKKEAEQRKLEKKLLERIEEVEDNTNDEMNQILGFSGFNSSKK